MTNNLETIIKDLYELDPSLQAEDIAVREVVASLLANKPVVLPDPAFVADLRAKLMVAHSTKPIFSKPTPSLWLMYFAPIGVVAILIFMLVPKPLSHPMFPTVVDETVLPETPSELGTEIEIDNANDVINSKRSFVPPETTPVTDMRVAEMALPVEVLDDTFDIYEQLPGQIVSVYFSTFVSPTFLVIQKDREGMPGEVVGVSRLIKGQVEGFEIVLMTKMLEGETFFATAYRDNGDGIYTPGKDAVVLDVTGSLPIQRMFSVSNY